MLPLIQVMFRPLRAVSLFLLRHIGVPIYRTVFALRRFFSRVAKPTKHRLLFIITNRYTFHIVAVCLVGSVVWFNMSTRNVRAETFGQESILYKLVVTDDYYGVDTVSATDDVAVLGKTSRYADGLVLDARLHVDTDFFDESYVTPESTEGIMETQRLVSKRDTVETYTVEQGDTLGGIAERFGLNLSTVLWANDLTFRSTIRPGDHIEILPKDGIVHKVSSGDTLSRIARTYSVSTSDILDQNQLASADTLSIGQKLLIPGAEPPSVAPVARRSMSVANLFTAPAPSRSGSSGWIWPTDWHVITQYYGWRHTGVDIDGDYSTRSYASRDGRVVFAGWRSGYGLTVEIDHGDGYMTRYAHHSRLFVGVGEIVSAGQSIAQTGTTGRSTGTHLHFEIIRGGRFLNPLDFVR
jgi:LysM repeat protein